MIRTIVRKQLDNQEKDFGISLDYVDHILQTSLISFIKFAMFMPLAQHRRQLPSEAYAIARILATKYEDCGTCVQLEVNHARKAGVSADIIHAVLENMPSELTPELARVYHHTWAVINGIGFEETYRDEIRAQWGEEALVELALAIGSSRFFPIVKRSLGYATSCSAIEMHA